MASLLVPDPATLALFHGFPEWGEVIHTQRIATRRLDDIDEVEKVDYLKIDGSFVRQIDTDQTSCAMVQSIAAGMRTS